MTFPQVPDPFQQAIVEATELHKQQVQRLQLEIKDLNAKLTQKLESPLGNSDHVLKPEWSNAKDIDTRPADGPPCPDTTSIPKQEGNSEHTITAKESSFDMLRSSRRTSVYQYRGNSSGVQRFQRKTFKDYVKEEEPPSLECWRKVRRRLVRVFRAFRRPAFLRFGGSQEFDEEDVDFWDASASWREDIGDCMVALTIAINGIFMGLQTDHIARNLSENVPAVYVVGEVVFCLIFTIELLLRLGRHRLAFFTMNGKYWNVFDALLVCLQWLETPMLLFGGGKSDPSSQNSNFTSLRLMRILRLLRIMRMLRILQFSSDITVVINAIVNSMRSLIATIVLLFLMMYAIGIVFTQVTCTHRIGNVRAGLATDNGLSYYWGGLPRSILSLLESIMGGVDWDDTFTPLLGVSIFMGIAFLAYVCFSLLAMMNVITGIFVESALKKTEKTKAQEFTMHVRNLFHMLEPDHDGHIIRNEYMAHLTDPKLQAYMNDIGIDPGEARLLFDFLDCDGSDSIDSEELLSGLIRLRVGAKFMDVMTIMHEIDQNSKRWLEWTQKVDQNMQLISAHVESLPITLSESVKSESDAYKTSVLV
eukprot:CAMPEP_0197875310 /NCGR_PEP_ID=MMETSP1439-20131203/4589_1 /TAXON_ID=66791 /ORGANISM="Gonyaulax spinifera, Strain CCMP409" /LENGTH=588 /DNA_ID=CAMNT_0043494499 /DNA_START=20 /DNA_END=1786 /DNA_ORIENTATION=+